MMRQIIFVLIIAGSLTALAQDQLSVSARKQPRQRYCQMLVRPEATIGEAGSWLN